MKNITAYFSFRTYLKFMMTHSQYFIINYLIVDCTDTHGHPWANLQKLANGCGLRMALPSYLPM